MNSLFYHSEPEYFKVFLVLILRDKMTFIVRVKCLKKS